MLHLHLILNSTFLNVCKDCFWTWQFMKGFHSLSRDLLSTVQVSKSMLSLRVNPSFANRNLHLQQVYLPTKHCFIPSQGVQRYLKHFFFPQNGII